MFVTQHITTAGNLHPVNITNWHRHQLLGNVQLEGNSFWPSWSYPLNQLIANYKSINNLIGLGNIQDKSAPSKLLFLYAPIVSNHWNMLDKISTIFAGNERISASFHPQVVKRIDFWGVHVDAVVLVDPVHQLKNMEHKILHASKYGNSER